MINFLRFLLVIYFLFVTDLSFSQESVLNEGDSRYTYIYQITASEAKCFVGKYYLNVSNSLFYDKIDSSLTANGSYNLLDLPKGHFLISKVVDGMLDISYHQNVPIGYSLGNNYRDLEIMVYEKNTGKIITDADVFLGRKRIKYNELSEFYYRKNNKKSGVLTICVNQDTAFLSLENQKLATYPKLKFAWRKMVSWGRKVGLYKGYRHDDYYYIDSELNGYLAFSKPKYRLNDTLKWKSFLVKSNVKPYNKPIKIVITEVYGGAKLSSKVIHPITKGAYLGEVKLSDSLRLDSEYRFEIQSLKKQKTLMTKRFLVEDYQLNKVTFDLRVPEKEYHQKELVAIFLSGKDANGFDVADARAKVVVSTNHVTKIVRDTVFVPELLWEQNVNLDPMGETKLILPDSIFPYANINVNVKVIFNTSENETHTKSENFDYKKQANWIDIELKDDLITAQYFHLGNEIAADGKLFKVGSGRSPELKTISFPFEQKIDPSFGSYEFITETTSADHKFRAKESLVFFSDVRSDQGIHLKLNNPRKLRVKYSLERNKRLVAEGVCFQLDSLFQAMNDDVYVLRYSYLWGAEIESKNRRIYKFTHNLKVKIDLPKRVTPGQKVEVSVEVSDINGAPAKQVNLTAFSTNNLFKENTSVSVPYHGKSSFVRTMYSENIIDATPHSCTRDISEDKLLEFGVDTMPFYRLMFPKDGFHIEKQKMEEWKLPQFSPFVFDNGRSVRIHVIYVDGVLVHYDKLKLEEYAFELTPGCHNITLRTSEKEFRVLDFCVDWGEKIDFSLAYDSTSSKVVAINKPDSFDNYERRLIHKNVLLVENNFNEDVYFIQKDHVIRYKKSSDNLWWVGPFDNERIDVAITNGYKTSFDFEPGYKYTFSPRTIKMERSFEFPLKEKLSYWGSREDFGAQKKSVSVVRRKNRIPKMSLPIFEQKVVGEKGDGLLILTYGNEEDDLITQLQKVDDSTQTFLYNGHKTKYSGLQPGYYRFLIGKAKGEFRWVDSIQVNGGGVNYQVIDSLDFDTLQNFRELENAGWRISPKDTLLLDFVINDSIGGMLMGQIVDSENNDPIPFVKLVLKNEDRVFITSQTDFEGEFAFTNIPPGTYSFILVGDGYASTRIENVKIANNKISPLKVKMSLDVFNLREMVVVSYTNKLIDKGNTSVRATVSAEDFGNMAIRSAADVFTNVPGVYASDDGAGYFNVRGARADADYYYIDGMKVLGSSNLPKSAIGYVELYDENQPDIGEAIEKELASPSLRTVRNNFDDCGFWEPNLYTDANGKASFSVVFPDNITKWETQVLAMDQKKRSGKGVSSSVSFKPIMAELGIPRFLIEGDSSTVLGKVTSYVNTPQKISTFFYLNGDTLRRKEMETNLTHLSRFPIHAPQKQELTFGYGLNMVSGYADVEEKSIPVHKKGMRQANGEFYVLRGDTTVTIPVPKGQLDLYAQGDYLQYLLKNIEYLENYPYSCMEQTSSKLIGYLLKEQILTAQGRSFKDAKQIDVLVKKLIAGQNDDGGWGWWPGNKSTHRMSIYVLDAIMFAKESGYVKHDFWGSFYYLTSEINQMSVTDKLSALKTILKINSDFKANQYLRKVDLEDLSFSNQLRYYQVQQVLGETFSIDKLKKESARTLFGNIYWKGTQYGWDNSSIQNTLMAYSIIETNNPKDEILFKVRDYFTYLGATEESVNTLQRAQILKVLLPHYLNDSTQKVEPNSLSIEGYTQSITDFPYQQKWDSLNQELVVNKKGSGTVYLGIHQFNWNEEPKVQDSLFEVESHFVYQNDTVNVLKSGETIELRVKIKVKQSSDYVMIEIPIPGGCSYGMKNEKTNRYEVHREFYKEKVNLYCKYLPEGEYVFSTSLQPRYSGRYTLNPVQIQQMYFPILSGNNEMKTTDIE